MTGLGYVITFICLGISLGIMAGLLITFFADWWHRGGRR